MPWKNILDGHGPVLFVREVHAKKLSFAQACREHGISRKNGYKWWARFERSGFEGLHERSRRPRRSARAWSEEMHARVNQMRRRHSTWGATKLLIALREHWPRCRLPHPRTLERWMPRTQCRHRARPGPPAKRVARRTVHRPNAVWSVDFKGPIRLGDGSSMAPLTVRDQFSRQILLVHPVDGTSDQAVRRVFTRLFRRCGLPRALRMDNGPPFGGCGALGLSTLSVWWLRLGIDVEFSRPGHPQDNAAHEQMHRVLKRDTATPPARTRSAQNRRLQCWRKTYNEVRPHAALGGRKPAQLYRPSSRPLPVFLPAWRYPSHWLVRTVKPGGRIRWLARSRLIGRAFAGESIGLRPHHGYHVVYLGPHLLGHLHPGDPAGIRPVRRSDA